MPRIAIHRYLLWSNGIQALLLSACFLVSALAANAQPSRNNRAPHATRAGSAYRASQERRLDTTFAVERGTVLDMSAGSAKITVRGWSRSEMQVISDASSSDIGITYSARTVRVEAGAGRRRNDSGNIEVRAPRGTRVLVSSRQGDVQVLDVGGAVDATVVAGDITVRGSAERADISVALGDIRVSDADGPVHIDAISGDVVLDDVRGDVELSATSSDVTMRRVRAIRVEAQVVSGNVTFDGPLAENGRYEFTTHAGDVRVYLAAGAKGTLEAQSLNGGLHTTIPMVTAGGRTRAQLQSGRAAVLRGPQRYEFGGGGSAQIIISTFTGEVHIDRGPRRAN
jgi:hypothetical protein